MVFNSIYNGLRFIIDPIFNPILNLPPLLAILLIAIIISLITTFAYKWLTNQEEMKRLKQEQKALQKKVKEHRNEPQKMMQLNKEAMQKSTKLMSASMKPMFITMLPIILIFMWLNLHLSYLPIMPNDEFTTTAYFKKGTMGEVSLLVSGGLTLLSNSNQVIEENKASWTLKGDAGEYILEYQYDNRPYFKDLLITTEKEYKTPIQKVSDSNMKSINVDHEKLKVNLGIIRLSWFWTYLIFVLVISSTMRKVFKVY